MVNTAARATSPPINQSQTSIVTSSSSLQQYQSLNNGNNNSNSSNNSKQFCDNFWGDKINGFDVLCQNLKHSLISVKDLETFLRESANCEDSYGKVLNKLVTQINRFSANGSFNPLWSPLKELNEKYALKHVEMVHSLHEVIKDIQRYNDELSKKIKKIRENEIQTQNIVQSFQEVQLLLNKTKEQYHNLCVEYEKQKRQLDPQQLAQYQQQQLQQQISSTNLISSGNQVASGSLLNGTANLTSLNPLLNTNTSNINLQSAANSGLSSQPVVQSPSPAPTSTTDRLSSLASSITVSKVSQVQKAEKKLRLALEEYKSTIDKYNMIRVDFERKLAESCEHFQYAEDTHLKQMRVFVDSYSKLVTNVNSSKQQIYNDFQAKFEQNTSDYLLQLFVDNKKTGTERPDIAQFVDQFDYAKLATNNQNGIASPIGNNNATLINETDFNLFINGGNQFTNTSLNTSYLSSNSNSLIPPPPMLSSTQPSFSQQNSANSLLTSSNTNDTTDNRANGADFHTNGNRATPTFFNSANIMGSNSFYSQLTNSVSTTTLNSIQQPTINTIVSTSSAIGTASPINFPTNGASITPNNVTTTTTTENMKRSDSKGINIFNVDFLGRNKNKEKKAAQKAAAAAAAAIANEPHNIKTKQIKNTKKTKQNLSVSTNQYENLNSTSATATFTNGGLSVSNNSNRDSSSINSEDSNERVSDQNMIANTLSQIDSTNQNNQQGSITARSISSITGSLSFDLLDQLKISNGSDIDSEGYSIRPESSSGLSRKKKGEPLRNKDNEDMNNLYASSTTNSDSDDSDSENGDGGGPLKVNIKIKPKSEVVDEKKTNNDAVLREISKNLQLIKPANPQLNSSKQQPKKRTYYYNYGTSNPDQASSGWSTSISDGKTPENETGVNSMMTRSVSVGSVAHSSTILGDLTFNSSVTKANNSESLFDFGLQFGPTTNIIKPVSNNQTTTPSIPNSMSLNKVNETNLYNIEEDKEVESSFQYDLKRANNYVSSSPANTSNTSSVINTTNQNNSMVHSTSVNGRFTPACFPGRTTPDFRITTSLFEQQSTRASIISPLTVNGSDLIPIAVAFNETIHAYFKSGDISKFKVKCFGCMKISFPFAVLKFLNSELPLLEFKLSNLQIANQDLKTNNQLLSKVDSTTPSLDSFQFKFSTPNLVQELKQQHQQNKLAAFFNFELLKYEFKYSTTPLVLNANWSNNPIDNTIELNLNYQFNFRKNLSQVNFMIVMPTGKQSTAATSPIDKISLVKSEPTALIQENDNKMQILWQFATLNTNGSLTAKFSIPTSFTLNQAFNSMSSINSLEHFYQPVYAKFNIENETLSQVKFEILSNSYKLSLLKEKIETGKYFSNNDHQQTNNSITPEQLNQNSVSSKKAPFAGSLSTSIGSTVDIFLNL